MTNKPTGPGDLSAQTVRPSSDLPTPRLNLLLWRQDPSLRYQWWLIAFSSFLVTLVLLSMTAVSDTLASARSQVQAELTIQVPTQDDGFRADGASLQLDRVTKLLEATPGVSSIRLLSLAEVRDILKPWVGDDVELQGLPVPYVIAVGRAIGPQSNRSSALDLVALKGRLDQINPDIVVDDHAATLSDVRRLARVALSAVVIAYLVAILMLSGIATIAVNTALRMQREVLDVLFLAGASDRFIARQFILFGLGFTLRGLAIGGGAAVCLYALALPVLQLQAIAGPWLGLSVAQGIMLAGLAAMVLGGVGFAIHVVVVRRLHEIY